MSVSRPYKDRNISQLECPSKTRTTEEIYNVISDAKIRELKNSMEKPRTTNTSRILHFSDGTLNIDDLPDDESETADEGPSIDPKLLTWAPWMWYQTLTVGSNVLKVCDFLGGHLASFFGITTPKYQLEIEERLAMVQEEKEEQEQAMQNLRNWSGSKERADDFLERGDFRSEDDVMVIQNQPKSKRTESGSGDGMSRTTYI